MLSLKGYRPRLRFTLLLLILGVGLVGITALWMLEARQNSLIRQTERLLTVQGIQLASNYRQIFDSDFPDTNERYGTALPESVPSEYEKSITRWELPVRFVFVNMKYDAILEFPSTPKTQRMPDPIAASIGEKMSPILSSIQDKLGSEVHLTDYAGVIISSTKYKTGLLITDRDEVRYALQGKHYTLIRKSSPDQISSAWGLSSFGEVPRVHSAVPILFGSQLIGTVLLSRHPPRFLDTLTKRPWTVFKYLIAIITLLMLFSLLTSWFITKPISLLVKELTRSRQEKVPVKRLPLPVTLELDQLSESITLLTEQLHENSRIIEKDAEIIRANSEIIKTNAEAVKTDALSLTHELESEIGGIRSRIRILRDSLPELSTPQKDSFSEILSDAHRVIKTGQKLLEIAKAETIENGENSISIIGHTLTEVENRFRDPPLMIQFDCDQSIKVVMEQHRLISVIANLIDNAYTHGGHSVKIRVATDDLLGNCVIDVENEGTSISDYDSQQIFDRFFTGDRDAGHTGLGLNLVQTQLRTHKGDITLLRDSKLVTFRVTLPLMS